MGTVRPAEVPKSRRLAELPPFLFMETRRRISEALRRGMDVISLGIGDPDGPTPAHVVDALARAAADPANQKYPPGSSRACRPTGRPWPVPFEKLGLGYAACSYSLINQDREVKWSGCVSRADRATGLRYYRQSTKTVLWEGVPLPGQCVISRVVTVAKGVFAPGHLGELTQVIPFELVDAVLAETGRVQRRVRLLASRVVVYWLLALGLWASLSYRQVWGKLVDGLGAGVAWPSVAGLRAARRRVVAVAL
jgi:hypothetical protein